MKTGTNVTKYRILAPVYDFFFHGLFQKARRRALSTLPLDPGVQVLLVGVGTGEDLPLLPKDIDIVGIDISEPMLRRARGKVEGRRVKLEMMDAENLTFQDQSFDAIILHLILSVVENPRTALTEAIRVLKPDGRILVFDKFVPGGGPAGPARKVLNVVTSMIGTDITRRFEDIAEGLPIQISSSVPAFGGQYRAMILEKR